MVTMPGGHGEAGCCASPARRAVAPILAHWKRRTRARGCPSVVRSLRFGPGQRSGARFPVVGPVGPCAPGRSSGLVPPASPGVPRVTCRSSLAAPGDVRATGSRRSSGSQGCGRPHLWWPRCSWRYRVRVVVFVDHCAVLSKGLEVHVQMGLSGARHSDSVALGHGAPLRLPSVDCSAHGCARSWHRWRNPCRSGTVT